MKIVGIDPGLSGAACIYDADAGAGDRHILDVIDMPTEPWGTKRHIEIKQLLGWVWKHRCDTAAIERVNAMPSIPDAKGARRGMGSASSFRFGMCYGEVRGALVGAGLHVVDVIPKQWQDLFELLGRPKDASREMAIELFPEAREWLKRKKDIGRADSMLIARWASQNRWENR